MIAKRSDISVLGSLNVDIFICMDRLPRIGETIESKEVKKAFGGKVSKERKFLIHHCVCIRERIKLSPVNV